VPVPDFFSTESRPPGGARESVRSGPPFKVVALAASAGGVEALLEILADLPPDFPAAIVIVQHRTTQEPFRLPAVLGRRTALPVEQAKEGAALSLAKVFVAPPDWHLLVNDDASLSLADSVKVNSVRPSADRLFESLASSFGKRAIGVVLTGAACDGSYGVTVIKKFGGVVIAQDPATAAMPGMPRAAIATGAVDFVVPLEKIAACLRTLVMQVGCEA